MEVYTDLVSFNSSIIFVQLLNLCIIAVLIYITYLVIRNLQLSKKLLTKKCEDEGLIEIKEKDSFLVKKEVRNEKEDQNKQDSL